MKTKLLADFQICISVSLSVFVNCESALIVAFVKYTLSKLYSHRTQNCNFYYFLGTITKL